MSRSTASTSELRAARRERLVCGLLLVAAAVVLGLAARGSFSSMMMFPLIFAVIVSVVALLTLLNARGVLLGSRVALVAAVILVAAAAPIVHQRGFERSLQRAEREAMDAIGGRAAPEIAYLGAVGLDAGQASPARFGERLTLLNFWATWCSACVSELPALERFRQQHQGEIDVIGVTRLYGGGDDPQSVAAELDEMRGFVEERGLGYPTLVDAGDPSAHRAYRVASLPSSVLIDRDGVVVAYGAGVSGTERLMQRARELLADAR